MPVSSELHFIINEENHSLKIKQSEISFEIHSEFMFKMSFLKLHNEF